MVREKFQNQAALFSGKSPATSHVANEALLSPVEISTDISEIDPTSQIDFNRTFIIQLPRTKEITSRFKLANQTISCEPVIIGQTSSHGVEVLQQNLVIARSTSGTPSHTTLINQRRRQVFWRKQRKISKFTPSPTPNVPPNVSSVTISRLSNTWLGFIRELGADATAPLEAMARVAIKTVSTETTNLVLTAAGVGFAAIGIAGVAAGVDRIRTVRKAFRYQVEEGNRAQDLFANNRVISEPTSQVLNDPAIIDATETLKANFKTVVGKKRQLQKGVERDNFKTPTQANMKSPRQHNAPSERQTLHEAELEFLHPYSDLRPEIGMFQRPIQHVRKQAERHARSMLAEEDESEASRCFMREEQLEIKNSKNRLRRERACFDKKKSDSGN